MVARPGQVIIKFGKHHYADDLTAPADRFIKVLQQGIVSALKKNFIEITAPKLQRVAKAMERAGQLEFDQLAPYVTQQMIGIPNTPGATTVLQFPNPAAGNRIFDEIVPSTDPGRLNRIKLDSDRVIWRALSKKYWERKGKKGFFVNKGELGFVLQEVLKDVPRKVGNLKVTYNPENLESTELDFYGRVRDHKMLLGLFVISYVKQRFTHLIPALLGRISDVDSSYGLEKALFNPRTVQKLGVDLTKQRPLVQPVLGWFLLQRIPAAMSKVAAEVLR